MSAISLFSVLLPFLLSIPTPTGALLHATAICGGHNFIEHQTQNETWQIVTTRVISVCVWKDCSTQLREAELG